MGCCPTRRNPSVPESPLRSAATVASESHDKVEENAIFSSPHNATKELCSSAVLDDVHVLESSEAGGDSCSPTAIIKGEMSADPLEVPGAIATTPRTVPQCAGRGSLLQKRDPVVQHGAIRRSSSRTDVEAALDVLAGGDTADREARDRRVTDAISLLDASDDCDVEVLIPLSARKMLLSWVRLARKSKASQSTLQAKTMDSAMRRRPRSSLQSLSPQPTPRRPIHSSEERSCAERSHPEHRPAVDADHRNGRTLQQRRAQHSVPLDNSAFQTGTTFLDALRSEQHAAMDAQGTKLQLCQKLGAAEPRTLGKGDTPGFGIDTPNFVGASASECPSNTLVSAVSSGKATPALAGGQMSPWLLEAVAQPGSPLDRCPEPVAGSGLPSAWGELNSEAAMENLPGAWGVFNLEAVAEDAVIDSSLLIDQCEYEDELDRVDIFIPSNQVSASDEIRKVRETRPRPISTGSTRCSTSDTGAPQSPKGQSLFPHGRVDYKVGDVVRYWSSTQEAWIRARVEAQLSRSVYLIDKGMCGCLAKVRASELLSEQEEKRDHVLRAFMAFGEDGQERAPTPPPRLSARLSAKQSQASPCLPAAPARLPVVPARAIVRDDFSDDSD